MEGIFIGGQNEKGERKKGDQPLETGMEEEKKEAKKRE